MSPTTIDTKCRACGGEIASFEPYPGFCTTRCFVGGVRRERPPGPVPSIHPGAFFLTPLWLLCHNRFGLGLALVFGLLLAPTAVEVVSTTLAYGDLATYSTLSLALLATCFLLYLTVACSFGRRGYEIVARELDSGFGSMKEVVREEREWVKACLVFFSPTILTVLWPAVALAKDLLA